MSFAATLLILVLLINLVVLWNNLARLMAARALDVPVAVISVGYIKEMVGLSDRSGTRWRLGWWPIGGYLKFKAEDLPRVAARPSQEESAKAILTGAAETLATSVLDGPQIPTEILQRILPFEKEDRITGKSHLQTLGVAAAGPIACAILALAVFAAIFAKSGAPANPLELAINEAIAVISTTYEATIESVGDWIFGSSHVETLGGPIATGSAAASAARSAIDGFMYFTATMALGLALWGLLALLRDLVRAYL